MGKISNKNPNLRSLMGLAERKWGQKAKDKKTATKCSHLIAQWVRSSWRKSFNISSQNFTLKINTNMRYEQKGLENCIEQMIENLKKREKQKSREKEERSKRASNILGWGLKIANGFVIYRANGWRDKQRMRDFGTGWSHKICTHKKHTQHTLTHRERERGRERWIISTGSSSYNS